MRLLLTLVQLAGLAVATKDLCSINSEEVLTPWIKDDYGRLQFPVYNADPIKALEEIIDGFQEGDPCVLNSTDNNVICKGNLRTRLFKNLNETSVKNLIVVNYNTESNASAQNALIQACDQFSNPSLVEAEERDTGLRLKMSSGTIQYKVTGDVYSSAIGMGMHLSATLTPNMDYDGFIINGSAFSNELRVGWPVEGELKIDNNNTYVIIKTELQTVGPGGWKFQGTCVLLNQKDTGWSWTVNGTVDSALLLAPISFAGQAVTTKEEETYRISGDVLVKPLKIVWEIDVTISASLSADAAVTICREFLKNVTLKHLYFKDSSFMGDFSPDALQGVKGLETITFSNSKLEEMPHLDKLFNGLSSLKAIYLESSTMPQIEMGNRSTLTSLELISLKGSGPLPFTQDSMKWLADSNLTYLNLQDCNINVADSNRGVLEPVSRTLRYLDLSYTSLSEETALVGMLRGLQLTHLSLAGLQLSKIPASALAQVNSSLKYLTLRENNFRKVPDQNMFDVILDFPEMSMLEELDLTHCGINYIEAGAFNNLIGLKRLFLGHNNVENVQEGWYMETPGLYHIDLSWNGETVERAEFSLQPGEGIKHLLELEIVDFSNAVFTYPETMVLSLTNKTRILSLCNNNLRSYEVLVPLSLPNLTILDISGNPTIEFGNPQVAQFFYSLNQLQRLFARNNRITNSFFSSIHDFAAAKNISIYIESLEMLDLSGNSIKALPTDFFTLFPNLQYLDMTGNSIIEWTPSLSLAPKLRTLLLSDNKMETIPPSVLQDLLYLNMTELSKNPFACDCNLLNFANAVTGDGKICGSGTKSHAKAFSIKKLKFGSIHTYKATKKEVKCVTLEDWMNGSNYYCYTSDTEEMKWLLDIRNDTEMCKVVPSSQIQESENFVALYVGVAVALAVALAGCFIYWKWWEIRLMTRAVRNAAILTFMDNDDETEEPKNMQYHAFVSYCEKDRQWVTKNMLPRLEQWNEIRVCLHERDFEVGVSIMENITSSMDKSRHLVIVLSQSFVRSQWCQFELQLAQHRIIENKRDKLVLVLLEPIPSYKKPKTLRYLMRTNTYIEWPAGGTREQQERFWERLLKAIA